MTYEAQNMGYEDVVNKTTKHAEFWFPEMKEIWRKRLNQKKTL